MSLFPEPQSTFDYPQRLVEKYRPRRVADFIGMPKERKIITTFLANPREMAFYFHGLPGLGKTALGMAMSNELEADFHHIASQKCNVDVVEEVTRLCWNLPYKANGFHLVLADEVNDMSKAAQLSFLSKLDSTARPPKTVFVFTSNVIDRLEAPFKSRCLMMEFSNYGLRAELAKFLEYVWKREAPHSSDLPEAKQPDFERIAKDSTNNVRDALNRLELELMAA